MTAPAGKNNWQASPKGRRCVALSMNGRRCRRAAYWTGKYHGDGESYRGFQDNDVMWVVVDLCKTHAARCP